MTAQTRPTKSTPSVDAIERRVERAERQAEFAEGAGWTAIAVLYKRLASDLTAMLPTEPDR